jgi:hypothetical protein
MGTFQFWKDFEARLVGIGPCGLRRGRQAAALAVARAGRGGTRAGAVHAA